MNIKRFRKKSKYTADKSSKKSNFEYLNLNYCKTGQTVLAGDSITEMYNHTEMFARYTEETGICVYNRGISGDTSDRLLERFESTVLNIEPKNIVLLIGTNDFNIGADINYIAENIEKIIKLAKEKCDGVHIILEAVYPVNSKINNQGKRNNRDITALNERLKAIAKANETQFIDLTSQLADQNGNLNAKYTYDGLHVNSQAYRVITNAIVKLLK